MDKPKYTINVTVDKPELIPETPNANGECTGFVLIQFSDDNKNPGNVTISGATVTQIAHAIASNPYLQQGMALAEGYIKAMEIARKADRANSLFDLLVGGDK